MTDKNFMRVEDVARQLDVSKSYAYKIVQKLNEELDAKPIAFRVVLNTVIRPYATEKLIPRSAFSHDRFSI